MKDPAPHLNRYEQVLAAVGHGAPLFRSVLPGVSRATRLAENRESEHLQTIWNTAANVIGPILLGYVLWVFRQAQAMNLNRLYFVSRDGQVLHRIAKLVNQHHPTGIACRYLYGSRHAWQLPSVTVVDEQALAWMFSNTTTLTVQCVCDRVDLAPADIEPPLSKSGFPRAKWRANLSASERLSLRECFRQPAIREAIVARTIVPRRWAVQYLEQEGMLADERFAIVDIGWGGRLQAALSKLLATAGFRPASGIKGLYFGLTEMVKASPNDRMNAYYIAPGSPSAHRLLSDQGSFLEIFTAADHQGVRGYSLGTNGRIVPVFFDAHPPPAVAWGVADQQAGTVQFADEMLQVMAPSEFSEPAMVSATEKLLWLFCCAPSVAESRAYGQYQISEHQTGDFPVLLTPTIGHQRLWRHLLWGQPAAYNGEWLAGAVRSSDLRFAGLYLHLLGQRARLRRRYRETRSRLWRAGRWYSTRSRQA